MSKRIFAIIIALCLVALVGFSGFSVWHSVSNRPAFETGGYIISEENMSVSRLSFLAEENYHLSSGSVKFRQASGEEAVVSQESFLHLDNGAVASFSDGVLLDFRDLSENFINNYVISAGLQIRSEDDGYAATTSSGAVTFGDHVWKLSDRRYLVQSPELTVCFSQEDERDVEDYVLVSITEDGVVQMITKDNSWLTISEECYIETASGVRVYPMTQLVDNGMYKMSLAKLSVDVDDNIILTEAETRRQIVPELKIEAEDGSDGDDGNQGAAGDAGAAGEDGTDGESGESGQDGQGGVGGAAGLAGAGGEGGLQGTGGEGGANGQQGDAGATGATGGEGSKGNTGYTGTTGDVGNSALVDSSINSALPRMTFVDWQITTHSLRGSIGIVDENQYLTVFSGDRNYPATVTIENVATGEKIFCYEVIGTALSPDVDFEGIKNGADTVAFSTEENVLEPDTEYRISVVAYYKVNNMIFSREFLGRTFFTDAAGVYLTAEGPESTKIPIRVGTVEGVDAATVYLLTPTQNEGFSLASENTTGAFQYKCVLDYTSKTATLYDGTGAEVSKLTDISRQQLIRFEGLPSNTTYVARVSVQRQGLNTLTKQALQVRTLKAPPTWVVTEKPKVNYNRVTGGFEVYRPIVTDVDGGAVSYTYTAYNTAGDKIMERTLTAGESEPAVFHLNAGESYTFGVTLDFDDNVKQVIYDLGISEPVEAVGTALPKLILQENAKNYNSMKGTLKITLNAESMLYVNQNQPLELNIYADQIYDQTVVLRNIDESVTEKNMYTVTLDQMIENECVLALDLTNLYRNTGYIITLTGHIDLGDGTGAVLRTLGSVSFKTTDTDGLVVNMVDEGRNDSAIAMYMSIAPEDTVTDSQSAYDVGQLTKGQVTMQLYTGTGFGANLLATANINDPTDLEAVYGGGYLVTEEIFGNPSLDPEASYTLKVASVADQTYNMGLSYVNYFDSLANASVNIVADAVPPDLLKEPDTGVKATPIRNGEVSKYGGTMRKDLPEDAIMGYLLQAKFDNSQRLGLNLTYYAMEYNDFYNAVSASSNPLDSPNVLMTTTLDIKDQTTMPKVAYLFGGEKQTEGTFSNGTYVYYAGNPNVEDTALVSGMGRGFRYCFGYRVEYSTSGSAEGSEVSIYPDKHKDFENYKNAYGVGTMNDKVIGATRAYVLNSGMCEAPRVTPQIHSYVFNVTKQTMLDQTTSTGEVEIHYAWADDPDDTISEGGGMDETVLRWDTPQGEATQKLTQTSVGNSGNWYAVTVPYSASRTNGGLVDVVMDIDQYALNYDTVLSDLYDGTDEASEIDKFYLCRVPVEWAWGEYFTENGNQITIAMETSFLAENRIEFSLGSSNGALLENLSKRAASLAVTVETVGAANKLSKTFYMPLQINDAMKTYTANLSTGLLGMEFLGKQFKVTSAALYYDTGSQGWQIADAKTDNPYAMVQFAGTAESPKMGEYVAVNSNNGYVQVTASPRNGLLVIKTENVVAGLQNLQGKGKDDADSTMAFKSVHKYLDGDASGFTYHIHPAQEGVVAGNAAGRIANSLLAVKKVDKYVFSVDSLDAITLGQITPTITHNGHYAATTEIEIRSFDVAGHEQVSDRKVYAALYDNERNASNLVSPPNQLLELTLDEKGHYKGGDKFTNLASDVPYYITYYMKLNGQDLVLLDSTTTKENLYSVRTTEDVTVKAEYQYENLSYFGKNLIVKFSFSRSYNVKPRYDFFRTELDAMGETAEGPLLSYEQMVDNKMLTEPGNVSDARLTINLEPAVNRKDLVPGDTYYLRIQAQEGSGEDVKVVGQVIIPVTLPPIGNYGALIYAANATQDSLTFRVTINDSQNSFMGDKENQEGLGLYAVRFVYRKDGKEVRLVTTYDKALYSVEELRRTFELTPKKLIHNGSLTNQILEQGIDYYMQVYAVVDAQHRAESFPVNAAGDKHDYTYFFRKNGVFNAEDNPFHDLINATWGDDCEFVTSSPNPDEDIASRFLVAEKLQTTTNSDGVLLNEEKAVLTRSGSNTFQLLLPESFGLIKNDATHAFNKIEWNITGSTNAGKAVNYNGTSMKSKGDDVIRQTSGSNVYVYYYDIPQTVTAGNYAVVIQLYTSDTENYPAHTLSFTYYDR